MVEVPSLFFDINMNLRYFILKICQIGIKIVLLRLVNQIKKDLG